MERAITTLIQAAMWAVNVMFIRYIIDYERRFK